MADYGFLGKGWTYPLQITSAIPDERRVSISEYEKLVEESIYIILGTSTGERVMRPTFGSELKNVMFAPNNTSTSGLAIYFVTQALSTWEPRIEIIQVDANPDVESDRDNYLIITISYNVIATNNKRNIVYPFYLGGD